MRDNVAAMLADKIGELRSSGKDIERKLAALETAYDLITGSEASAERVEKTGSGRKRKSYTLDKQALPKTLAFVREAKYAVTPRRVAVRFKISTEAAGMRLRALLKRGLVARVAAGKYKAQGTSGGGVDGGGA